MKTRMKRVTALILAICMCATLSQVPAWAEELTSESAPPADVELIDQAPELTAEESAQEAETSDEASVEQEQADNSSQEDNDTYEDEQSNESEEEPPYALLNADGDEESNEDSEQEEPDDETPDYDEEESSGSQDDESEDTTVEEHNNYTANYQWTGMDSCIATITCEDCGDTVAIPCTVTVLEEENEFVCEATVDYQTEHQGTYSFSTTRHFPKVGTSGVSNGKMWYNLENGAVDIRGVDGNLLLQTTFEDVGYTTAIKYPNEDQEEITFNRNNNCYEDDNLMITPNLVFSSNGDYVVVTYAVKNKTSQPVEFSLGMYADIDITSNDYAYLSLSDTGVEMVDSNTNTVFYLACKNVPGIKNVDTVWIGHFNDRQSNLFNNSASDAKVEGIDSGLACSWKDRTVAANSTSYYAYEIGLGKGESIQMPEEHVHAYQAAFDWSSDYTTCSATVRCSDCGVSDVLNCEVNTEETDSAVTYTASVEYEGNVYTDTKVVEKEHTHTYNVTFEWAEDASACNAVVTCTGCNLSAVITCQVTHQETETAITYFASVEYDGNVYTGTKIVEKEAAVEEHIHTYNVAFEWAEDYSSCTAVVTCAAGDVAYEQLLTPVISKKDATCAENGETAYVASITVDGVEYTDRKTIDTAASGHIYDAPKFAWSDDYKECVATFVCSICKDVQSKMCDIEGVNHDELLIATVEFQGEVYTDIPPVTIKVLEDSLDGETNIGTHYLGSGDSLSLECNIPLKYFINVEVDGVLLDPMYYTLEEGSTILTFSSKYLDTLHTGLHDVQMNYQINGTAIAVNTLIKIQKQPVDNTASNHHKTETNQTPVRPNDGVVVESTTTNYGPVRMTAHLVDVNGNPMKNYILEIHSNPMSSYIDDNGRASFAAVEAGDHTIYLKDRNGTVVASKKVQIAFAEDYSITGDVINIIAGRSFTLHAKYDGEELILLSVEGGAPKTSDTANTAMWVMLMVCSAAGLFVITRKQKGD